MNTTTQAILIGVFVIAALAFRVYRQTQERRWSIRGMWIAPLIFLAITIAVIVYDGMQTWIAPIAAVFGLAAGVGVGLYQGTHTTLRVDRPNKSIYVRTTP
jgi:membrane associated rhomboid family serine protease